MDREISKRAIASAGEYDCGGTVTDKSVGEAVTNLLSQLFALRAMDVGEAPMHVGEKIKVEMEGILVDGRVDDRDVFHEGDFLLTIERVK